MAPFFMLDIFLTYLRSEKRCSENTCIAYGTDANQFFQFIQAESDEDIKEVRLALVRTWVVDLIDNDYSVRSVHRKIASIKGFYKWLQKEGEIEANPVQNIRLPKMSKKLPSFVRVEEVKEESLSTLFDDSFSGVRDRLIFELLYQTGIRLSELIGLTEVNVNERIIKVVGKRNKERIIPISIDLYRLIEKYRFLKLKTIETSEFLMVLDSGKKLYPKFVYRKINDYLGTVSELSVKSPHVLRHSFATHMLNNGVGLEVLKELLGHSNLSATQVYTHNSFRHLTDIYSQSHPRGTKK